MITLALQIFLMLLSAFLAGCMVGCLLRRSFHASRGVPADAYTAPPPSEPVPAPRVATPESRRFETALTGTAAPSAPAPQREPVVEVRPKSPPPPSTSLGKAEIEIVPAREAASRPPPQPQRASVPSVRPPPPAEPGSPPAPPVAQQVRPTDAPAPPPRVPPPARPAVEPPVRPAAPPPPPPPPVAEAMPARVPVVPPVREPVPPVAPRVVPAAPPVRPEPARPASAPPPPPVVIEAAPGAAALASYAAAAVAAAAAQAVHAPAEREPKAPPRSAVPQRTAAELSDAAALANYAAVALGAAAAPETDGAAGEVEAARAARPSPERSGMSTAPEAGREADAAAARQPADDLKRIRGIDPAIEGRLNALGVRRFTDVAGWTAADVTRLNQGLGFVGRIEQENWIEQAQILARGGDTEFSRRREVSQSVSAAGLAVAAATAAASAVAQASAGPDRFTRIIGIDPDTEQALYHMGYTRFSEIAHWSTVDVERVERELGRPGRVGLDNWVEQARVLARYAGETEARPARLSDAIRESRDPRKPSETAAQRPDLAGLRSVRSEALRGDTPGRGDRVDDLKRIRGIGVLIQKRLNALGVASYEQIANWTGDDIDSISSQLDFKGRIERENWIEQARILASGGQTEFSRRVDRGEVDSSKES